MKKSILLTFVILFSTGINAQNAIQVTQWSNQVAFENSSLPAIRHYGELSDSLKQAYGGISFYEHEGNYYPVKSWADYYYWFTQRYWYRFAASVSIYELYYFSDDDLNMARFISGNNYLADVYPSNCILAFSDPKIQNRMNQETSTPFSIEEFVKENALLRTLAKQKKQITNLPAVYNKPEVESMKVSGFMSGGSRTGTRSSSRPSGDTRLSKSSVGNSPTISAASKN